MCQMSKHKNKIVESIKRIHFITNWCDIIKFNEKYWTAISAYLQRNSIEDHLVFYHKQITLN